MKNGLDSCINKDNNRIYIFIVGFIGYLGYKDSYTLYFGFVFISSQNISLGVFFVKNIENNHIYTLNIC